MRYVIALVILAIILVAGLGMFLDPNDLISCQVHPSDKSGCQKVDAIVAVSGGDTEARTVWAVGLYKSGWADTIIFSGAAMDTSGPSNAAAMKAEAVKMGVDRSKILLDETSSSTKENAMDTHQIISQNGIKSIILVTSGYHQRRAFLEFHKYNPGTTIKNSPVPIDKDWSPFWWSNLDGWWLAGNESVKVISFYSFGT